jgi:hypothetical protein
MSIPAAGARSPCAAENIGCPSAITGFESSSP